MVYKNEKVQGGTMNEITENESILWASGHYLTNHLPEGFENWEEEKLDEYLLDNVWEPFEYYSANQIWEFIENLAYDFRTTVNHKIKEEL